VRAGATERRVAAVVAAVVVPVVDVVVVVVVPVVPGPGVSGVVAAGARPGDAAAACQRHHGSGHRHDLTLHPHLSRTSFWSDAL
jgi:hypothetical protein